MNDAQHDLARASGDVRTRIQQELAAHEAAMSKMNAQSGSDSQMAVLSTRQYGTLAHRVEAWFSQRSRYQLIQQAMQQARSDAASLTLQHNALEAQANASSDAAAASASKPDAARLASLQQRREQRQLLTIYDDRIQTQQQLAGVYGKWANQVLLQHRIVTHLGLRSLATVAFILICAILLEALGTKLLERHALNGLTFDRRRIQTLHTHPAAQCAAGWRGMCVAGNVRCTQPDLDHPGSCDRGTYGGSAKFHPRLLRLVHSHGPERNPRR